METVVLKTLYMTYQINNSYILQFFLGLISKYIKSINQSKFNLLKLFNAQWTNMNDQVFVLNNIHKH